MADDDNDYVLGTHDEELERLGLQHRVWRPRVLDAWRRAGFTLGQTIVDLGCGPGYATLDLAELVGPSGRVIALDQSQKFLSHLRGAAKQRGYRNIDVREIDLDNETLPALQADRAWCRWVIAFLTKPQRFVQQLASVVKPGGIFVSYEYFAYDSWRLLPPSAELTEFVRIVEAGWRASGGEPDIGLQLPRWLAESGFEIVDARPLVEVITPGNYVWQWPKSFVRIGADRYVELGTLTRERADEIIAAFERREREPNTMMITPGVLEITARRRGSA